MPKKKVWHVRGVVLVFQGSCAAKKLRDFWTDEDVSLYQLLDRMRNAMHTLTLTSLAEPIPIETPLPAGSKLSFNFVLSLEDR